MSETGRLVSNKPGRFVLRAEACNALTFVGLVSFSIFSIIGRHMIVSCVMSCDAVPLRLVTCFIWLCIILVISGFIQLRHVHVTTVL